MGRKSESSHNSLGVKQNPLSFLRGLLAAIEPGLMDLRGKLMMISINSAFPSMETNSTVICNSVCMLLLTMLNDVIDRMNESNGRPKNILFVIYNTSIWICIGL